MRIPSGLGVLLASLILCGCRSTVVSSRGEFSRFVAVNDFSGFAHGRDEKGQAVLLSPQIKASIPWNELIVSWNANAPAGTFLKIEAAAISSRGHSKFFTLGRWSTEATTFARTSVRGQRDADGTVHTDTLILKKPADAAQILVTLGGTNGAVPALKFVGLSFANTRLSPESRPPHRAAWGKIIATPERSQHGSPGGSGWCSPASLSMVLARWAQMLNRPEMNLSVPRIAAAVYDPGYPGTGNWAFNAAFAGGFRGMRGCVTRFDDLSEVEDWIAAGIPVILSARWDLLQPGRRPDPEGHLIVGIGFTENGDVVANDPAAHLDRGETVRQIYRREDVIRAWGTSHHTVYLVYPEDAKIPENRWGHW